jgi:predicted DsbA family dithiol-disulfide isomerase
VHFPLHPETPVDGQSLEALFVGRNIDLEQMYQQMKSLMEAEGLDYSRRTHTYNSRLAQELGSWADTQPDGERLHDALYRAYFVEGRNIGDPQVLIELAESVDLSGETAAEVLESRSWREAVDRDWQRSRELGITGVPTFVAGGYGIVGAQEYATLASLVQRASES